MADDGGYAYSKLRESFEAMVVVAEKLQAENEQLKDTIRTAIHWGEDICADALVEFLEESLR